MTVSLAVNNPAQAISLDMVQEQATQSLSLIMSVAISLSSIIADGTVAISSPLGLGSLTLARQPRSAIDMLLDESGIVLDFLLDGFIWKA